MLSLVRYVKAPLERVPRFPSFRAVGFNDFSHRQSALRECVNPIDGLVLVGVCAGHTPWRSQASFLPEIAPLLHARRLATNYAMDSWCPRPEGLSPSPSTRIDMHGLQSAGTD